MFVKMVISALKSLAGINIGNIDLYFGGEIEVGQGGGERHTRVQARTRSLIENRTDES